MSIASRPLRVNDFHLFRDRGRWHVLVVAEGALYRVDGPAREALESLAPHRRDRIDAAGFEPPIAPELRDELTALGVLGERASSPDLRRDAMLPHAPPPARTMSAMLTQSCNLACGYCYADEGRFGGAGGPPMTFETACRSIDLLVREAGPAELVTYQFLGGEPLLSARLVREIVAYGESAASVAGKCMRFSLTTNGTLLTREFIAFLLEHAVTCTISVDGPEDVHDLVRVNHAGKGSYARVIAASRPLLRARPTRARVTLTRRCLSVTRIVEHLLGEGFFEVGVTPVNSKDPRYAMSDADRDRLLDELRALVDRTVAEAKAGRRFGFANLTQLLAQIHDGRPSLHPCGAGISLFAVDAGGTIYPCHRFPGHEAYAMGHVETGIDREKQSEWLASVNVHNRSACGSCWARYICSGGCYYLSAIENGDVSETFTPICDHLRAWYEIGLGAYADLAANDPRALALLGCSLEEVRA